MADRVELLQKLAAFGGLTRATLEFLLERMETVERPAGEYFFRENEYGDAFYVLEAGRVQVLKTRDGVSVHLAYLEQGDCFGEMSLLAIAPRSASVRAVVDCRALKVANRALFELYQQNIAQFSLVLMNLGREVSRRLWVANELLFGAYVFQGQIQDDEDGLDDDPDELI